jgi:hypothetical protein
MRTAIFVYADTIDYVLRPEISALIKYTGPGTSTVIPTKAGTITLTKGIYKLVTDQPSEIRPVGGLSENHGMMILPSNKDGYPDPPAAFFAAFPEVTTAELRAFLPAALDAFGSPASDVPTGSVAG